MFGSGSRANSLSKGRVGRTSIRRPSSGVESPFGSLRAGDFFTYSGRLHLKINLVDAVEIPDGDNCIIGVCQFTESCPVRVENIVIEIK